MTQARDTAPAFPRQEYRRARKVPRRGAQETHRSGLREHHRSGEKGPKSPENTSVSGRGEAELCQFFSRVVRVLAKICGACV